MSRTFKHKYTKAKAVSKHCRNHGKCSWCWGNRHYHLNKNLIKIKDMLQDIIGE